MEITEKILRDEFEKIKNDNGCIGLLRNEFKWFQKGYSIAQETIKAKDAEIEDLKTKLNSALGELGYSVPGDTPILYKCGLCESKAKTIAEAREIFNFLFDGKRSVVEIWENSKKAKAWLENNK